MTCHAGTHLLSQHLRQSGKDHPESQVSRSTQWGPGQPGLHAQILTQNNQNGPGVGSQPFNVSTQESRQRDLWEFKPDLVKAVSSRLGQPVLHSETLFPRQQQQKQQCDQILTVEWTLQGNRHILNLSSLHSWGHGVPLILLITAMSPRKCQVILTALIFSLDYSLAVHFSSISFKFVVTL